MRRVALLSLSLLWVLACDSEDTWLDVTFHAEAEATERARSMRLRVWNGEGEEVMDEAVTLGGDGEALPVSVRLAPRRTTSAAQPFALEALLRDAGGGTLGTIVARGSYVAGRGATLDLWFDDACLGVACGPAETCAGGGCAGGCFEPAADGTRGRNDPVPCLGVEDVFVDAERGVDDPFACVDPATPCASVPYVLASYVAPGVGTTVHLRGEQDHFGPVVLRSRHSGTPEQPTRIVPWVGTGVPVLRVAGTGPTLAICCEAEAPHDVWVEGLALPGPPDGGAVVDVDGGRHLSFRDLHLFEVTPPPAIPFVGAIQIRAGASGITIRDSLLVDVARGVVGITVTNAADVRIDGVDFAHPRGDLAVLALDAERLTVRDSSTEGGRGGLLLQGSELRVVGNRFCHERSAAVRLGPSRDVVIEHNTMARDLVGISVDRRGVDVTVRSNIFSRIGNRALELWRYEAPETESHNLFHEVGGFLPSSFEATEGLMDVDPRFVDVESCDLRLQDDSPALGRAHDGGTIGAD